MCAIVGEIQSDGAVNIIGVGSAPSRGLRGVVVNIDSTVASIRQAVDEAQQMAGVDISSAYVGIAGGHIMGINSTGIIAVKARKLRCGKFIRSSMPPVPSHSLWIGKSSMCCRKNISWTIRRASWIPLGLEGRRLEAKVHIVTAAASAHNIVKCVNRAGIEVEDIV